MHIDHDQLDRIEIRDPVNDNDDGGDADRYHGRAVHPGYVIPVTVDTHAVLRDINTGDTITAAAYNEETLDALLTRADEDGRMDMETREDWQSTLRITAAGTDIE